jgi:hypothetical protein
VSGGKIIGEQRAPFRLGKVGGRIVAETFVGLLASDPNSIINNQQQLRQPQATSIKALFDRVADQRPAPRPFPVQKFLGASYKRPVR